MTTSTLNQSEVSSLSAADSLKNTLPALADLAGRVGLSAIFLLAGVNKIQYYDANAQYLASGGLPEFVLPIVILFEIIGALAVIVGYRTRAVALAFAGFAMATAALYHNDLADQIQFLMFFKNVAIAGGFLLLAAHGPGRLSLDVKI